MNISMAMYTQIPPLSISPQEQPPPGKTIQNSSEQKETTHSNYHRTRKRDKTHFVACGSCMETSPRMQTCRTNPETVSSGNSHQKCGPPYRQERVMSYSPPATAAEHQCCKTRFSILNRRGLNGRPGPGQDPRHKVIKLNTLFNSRHPPPPYWRDMLQRQDIRALYGTTFFKWQ